MKLYECIYLDYKEQQQYKLPLYTQVNWCYSRSQLISSHCHNCMPLRLWN